MSRSRLGKLWAQFRCKKKATFEKKYLKKGEKAPEGASVKKGKRGGMYYDSAGAKGGDSKRSRSVVGSKKQKEFDEVYYTGDKLLKRGISQKEVVKKLREKFKDVVNEDITDIVEDLIEHPTKDFSIRPNESKTKPKFKVGATVKHLKTGKTGKITSIDRGKDFNPIEVEWDDGSKKKYEDREIELKTKKTRKNFKSFEDALGWVFGESTSNDIEKLIVEARKADINGDQKIESWLRDLAKAGIINVGAKKKKAQHTGLAQIPDDYKKGGGQKKLYKYPEKAAKLGKSWSTRFSKKATHGKIPSKLIARFSNISMDKYSLVDVLFMKEGDWKTNGVDYHYPWEIIERDADSYVGRALYKDHDDKTATELGKIVDVKSVIVNGTKWLKAKIKVPEAKFTKDILDRIKNDLVNDVSSTHHFTYTLTPQGRVVDSITGRGISVLGAHEDGEVDSARIVNIKSNQKSPQYKTKVRNRLGNLAKNIRGETSAY